MYEKIQEAILYQSTDDLLDIVHDSSLIYIAITEESLEICKILKEYGADINCKNYVTGKTPLHLACSCGYIEIINWLLEQGANLRSVNDEGEEPINFCPNIPTALHLIKISPILMTVPDINGNNQLHNASYGKLWEYSLEEFPKISQEYFDIAIKAKNKKGYIPEQLRQFVLEIRMHLDKGEKVPIELADKVF